MKEMLSFMFSAVGVFFCFALLCFVVNPANITGAALIVWAISGFIISGWIHS